MQLFFALLAGFFLWLFVFLWNRNCLIRLRAVAGKVEFTVKRTRKSPWNWILLVFFCACLIILCTIALTTSNIGLGTQSGFSILFAWVLILSIPSGIFSAVEVCENGVICTKSNVSRSSGQMRFIPWNQIFKCQWVPSGHGHIATVYDNPNCLIIGEDSVPSEQRDAITATLSRYAPVYDEDEELLSKPENDRR